MSSNYQAYAPDESRACGEGVTRTSEPGASLYWVEVRAPHAAPIYSYVRATSPQQAVTFSRNRHPNAVLVRLMEDS